VTKSYVCISNKITRTVPFMGFRNSNPILRYGFPPELCNDFNQFTSFINYNGIKQE